MEYDAHDDIDYDFFDEIESPSPTFNLDSEDHFHEDNIDNVREWKLTRPKFWKKCAISGERIFPFQKAYSGSFELWQMTSHEVTITITKWVKPKYYTFYNLGKKS